MPSSQSTEISPTNSSEKEFEDFSELKRVQDRNHTFREKLIDRGYGRNSDYGNI